MVSRDQLPCVLVKAAVKTPCSATVSDTAPGWERQVLFNQLWVILWGESVPGSELQEGASLPEFATFPSNSQGLLCRRRVWRCQSLFLLTWFFFLTWMLCGLELFWMRSDS